MRWALPFFWGGHSRTFSRCFPSSAQLEKEVAALREKIHHLDDMLKSQQRKVRQMIEQVTGKMRKNPGKAGWEFPKPPQFIQIPPLQLQNSKTVIQAKDAAIQELKERVSYLEAEVGPGIPWGGIFWDGWDWFGNVGTVAGILVGRCLGGMMPPNPPGRLLPGISRGKSPPEPHFSRDERPKSHRNPPNPSPLPQPHSHARDSPKPQKFRFRARRDSPNPAPESRLFPEPGDARPDRAPDRAASEPGRAQRPRALQVGIRQQVRRERRDPAPGTPGSGPGAGPRTGREEGMDLGMGLWKRGRCSGFGDELWDLGILSRIWGFPPGFGNAVLDSGIFLGLGDTPGNPPPNFSMSFPPPSSSGSQIPPAGIFGDPAPDQSSPRPFSMVFFH